MLQSCEPSGWTQTSVTANLAGRLSVIWFGHFQLLDFSQRVLIRARQVRPPQLGRRRTKNLCMPSSTSSRRWLCTVLRKVTTPVLLPAVSSVTSRAG